MLERGDEGELHGLAELVASLGSGVTVLDGESLVRVRLHPDGLGERLAGILGGVGGRTVVDRKHALGSARDRVQAGVGCDPVEPRARCASAFEPVQAAPGAQQRVLKRVLGIVQRAEHPVAVGLKGRAVGFDEPLEGVRVAASSERQQFALIGHRGCSGRSHALFEIRPVKRGELIAETD